jgi:hypothetical protein
MDTIVAIDRNGKYIYEGDWVITKYGRVCKVVWRRNEGIIGYDLEPTGFIHYPPPDQYDMWKPCNLILLTIFNNDEVQEIINNSDIPKRLERYKKSR